MRVPALLLFSVLAVTAAATTVSSWSPPLKHPHFRKKIEVQLPGDITLTLSHITVTFDSAGAEKTPAGGSWHLGGATLGVTKAVKIGGVAVEAGDYALKTKKTEAGEWHLVLDAPPAFRSKITDAGRDLQTTFETDAPLFEHLSIDVQPSGDKSATKLNLDVRFDTKLARVEIELPEAPAPRRR